MSEKVQVKEVLLIAGHPNTIYVDGVDPDGKYVGVRYVIPADDYRHLLSLIKLYCQEVGDNGSTV